MASSGRQDISQDISNDISEQSPRAELIDALVLAMRDMSGATVFFHTAVAERLGLNPTDHKCADLIMRNGPLTAGALVEATGLTSGAVTGIVDRLERAGMVKRVTDPDDRRRVQLYFTDDQAVSERMWAIFEPIYRASVALFERYTDEELRLVLDVIGRCGTIALEAAHRLRDDS